MFSWIFRLTVCCARLGRHVAVVSESVSPPGEYDVSQCRLYGGTMQTSFGWTLPDRQFLLVRLLISDIIFTLLCRSCIAIILYYTILYIDYVCMVIVV